MNNQLIKEWGQQYISTYNKWKTYKWGYDHRFKPYYNHYNYIDGEIIDDREEVERLNVKVEKLNEINEYHLNSKHLHNIQQLKEEIYDFMKNKYDYKSVEEEMVWFEYGDIGLEDLEKITKKIIGDD